MRFKSFIGKKMHGYIDVDIDFNKDISILIGGNGSGKTTALKLIQALVTPSFEELIVIDFEYIRLEFIHRNKLLSIECEKNREVLRLKSSESKEVLEIENFDNTEYEYLMNKEYKMFKDKIQELPLIHRRHPVVESIVDISSPIFLGLDRKYSVNDLDERKMYNTKIRNESYTKYVKNRRLYSGNLSTGLYDAQVLITDFYQNLKSRDDANLSKMKEDLLLSSFKYREFDFDYFTKSKKNWQKKKEVLDKKDEVLEALLKIEGGKSVLTNELTLYFEKIEKLLLIDSSNKEDVNIELIINMTQIDKIFELMDIVQSNKEKTDKMYKKIYQFIDIINDFFKDSEKHIELDPLGNIMIRRPNGKICPVTALSSGERQLIVIFAHAFFNKYYDSEKVFIIDEPELSLHLRWQQIFIRTIVDNCPRTQFIMATHSPDIVDDYEDTVIADWRN